MKDQSSNVTEKTGSMINYVESSDLYRFNNCQTNRCCLHGRNGNCSRAESDLTKYKRSLKLVGIEPFGYGSEGKKQEEFFNRYSTPTSTISTRVISRSVSLDRLREVIRAAWIEDRVDTSHRRLLAQAAYEEWYFKKLKEFQEKYKNEIIQKTKIKEELQKEIEKKEAKAKEEFHKWFLKKENEKLGKRQMKQPSILQKRENDSNRAFLEWKKKKDKEFTKRKKEKQKEEEKDIELERQKNEKKIIAEKAFKQWICNHKNNKTVVKKNQLENTIKLKNVCQVEKENELSYFTWKKAKDVELKERIKNERELNEMVRAQQLKMVEERLSQAQEAFEDWLRKTDSRRKSDFCRTDTLSKSIRPWLPA